MHRIPRLRCLIALLGLPAMMASGCSRRDERIDVSKFVSIYPGAPIVELGGDSAPMNVVVRAVSENKLTRLRLEVKSEACAARVAPREIPELIPGDRQIFHVVLTRDRSKPRRRYPLLLTLHAGGLPVPAGLDLMVDLSPPPEKGWINVGQVTLIHQENTRTTYYLLAGAPLLLLVGWLLWRWSRPRPKRTEEG